MPDHPVILWFRRDLRLADNAAMAAAAGRTVIPVFLYDETVEALGAAARWRLGEGVRRFAEELEAKGSRLILRRGPALETMRSLVADTGADAVHWQRVYDRDGILRDRAVKEGLTSSGIVARSFAGATLFEPWEVRSGSGGPYKVFTPFWRAIREKPVALPLPAPSRLVGPRVWPTGDRLDDWSMGAAMNRGAAVVLRHAGIGEAVARARLSQFLEERLGLYAHGRDYPALGATSGLSENLAWGEISPRMIWCAAMDELRSGRAGAEKFLSELAWREFAWHLMFHFPDMDRTNWRAGWDRFPWRGDNDDAERWRRGITGEPFVDAAMRELYVTGRMHNRARMIAASFLTKHLMTDWRVGLRWFAECLTDWDPASNATGWQWVAGTGPDAAPFFRIFNPRLQAEKFDPDGRYRATWIAAGNMKHTTEVARSYFSAVPRAWGMDSTMAYPAAGIDLAASRDRAISAYRDMISAPAT
jgi:deoxyribodipyrimidine photo-lyase